jgi:hypothetical protein
LVSVGSTASLCFRLLGSSAILRTGVELRLRALAVPKKRICCSGAIAFQATE